MKRIATILLITAALSLAAPAVFRALGYTYQSATKTGFGQSSGESQAAFYDLARIALDEYLESHDFEPCAAPRQSELAKWAGMKAGRKELVAWYDCSKRGWPTIYLKVHQHTDGASGLGVYVVPMAEGFPGYRKSVFDEADKLVVELDEWWKTYVRANPRWKEPLGKNK
jgi:hypothetical protein